MFLVGSPLPAMAAGPIATTDGEIRGLSLQVQSLKVGSGTVMLKFTIVNDGTAPFPPGHLSDGTVNHPDSNSVSGVYLIDVANKKKYMVMYDAANLCVCTREPPNIEPKTSAIFWARFPAPPDNVQKIGIVVPHFLPLDDVPLSR